MRRFVDFVRRGLLVLAVAVSSTIGTPAFAQQAAPPEKPAVPAVEDLKALAATLGDEGRRAALVRDLNALIAVQEAGAAEKSAPGVGDWALGRLAVVADDAHEAVRDLGAYFGGWPTLADGIERVLADPAARARGLHEVLAFLGIFACGWVAEFVAFSLLAGTVRRLDGRAGMSGAGRAAAVVGRAMLDLLPLAAFAAAAYAGAIVIDPSAKVRAVGLNFVNAYLVARGLLAAARLVLAPRSTVLRLLPLKDGTARDLFVWFRRFVAIAVGGYFLIGAAFLLGLPRSSAEALLKILGAIVAVLAVVFVLRHRVQASHWLRRQAETAARRFGAAPVLSGLAAVWHLLAIAYIAGFFFVAEVGVEEGFSFMLRGTLVSLAIVAVASLVLVGVSRLMARLDTAVGASAATGSVSFLTRCGTYLPAVAGALRFLVVFAAVLALLQGWGVDVADWLARPFGRRATSAVVSILLVLAFAVVVWEIASSAIERYLTAPGADGSAVQRSQRVRTLLPLMRKGLFVFLSLMVALITLAEIGVDIAPLLAGAGVVGLAIGFGAQTLVKDIITGVFMLIEDALAVGDVVNVAGLGGLVEELSIRSIRLRDFNGAVHTVPFSSVGTVTNLTKDFSFYVLDIGISYDADVDQVARVCKEIVEQMRSEPPFDADILEPLEVFGVDQFADSAVIVKARIKTRPIRQWAVGREFNTRMKKRFEEVGIEIPFPQRTLHLRKGEDAAPLRVSVDGPPVARVAPSSAAPSPAAPSPAVAPEAPRSSAAQVTTPTAELARAPAGHEETARPTAEPAPVRGPGAGARSPEGA